MPKYILIVSFLICTAFASLAEDVSFTASAPSNVAVGERFRITFQVNARPSEFNPPAFNDFRVLSGPSQSSSTSVQMINGRTTQTISISYTYVLEATREGSFTIAPANTTVDGRSINSNAVTINVSSATTPPSTSPGPSDSQQPQQADSQDIFIRARVNNPNPFQGEQVIITYDLYTRVSVQQYSTEKIPSYQGFWSENITASGQPQVRNEVINGQTYRVAEVRRVALFAQRSGTLNVEPLEVDAVITMPGQRSGRSLFDEFFGGSAFDQRRTVKQSLKSNALQINVKPLPTINRPAAFKGMVGKDFVVDAHLNTNELAVNDAANLRISISGKGNMRMLEQPAVNFPANMEVFDPNVTDNISNTSSGVSGSRTFEYVLIPRTAGEYIIPPFSFAYFDPEQERYITRQTSEFIIEVDGDTDSQGYPRQDLTREDVKLLDTDIRYIKMTPVTFVPTGQIFYRSQLYWILLLAPFVLFIFFLIYWRNQIRLKSNTQLMKTRKAEKLARKRLKQAKRFLDKNLENEFYDEIFRALWGYLSDKLSIPVSILNKETVAGAFKAKKVPDELSESFLNTLNDCEFARFAPGIKEDKMDEIYQKALQTIVTIEKDLRSKKNTL